MICINCSEHAKYKCPTCRNPYCSVDCCKIHKAKPCSPPIQLPDSVQDVKVNVNYEYPTEDTVSPEKLALLQSSSELKNCLENPHVREILELLDKSPNPDMIIKKYMQETIFTEFVDACLSVIEGKQKDDK